MAKIVFVAQPDRYGRFGHQTFTMLTPLLLAHYLDELFIPIGYEYFAYKYNEAIDFSASKKAVRLVEGKIEFRRISREPIDVNGNTKYDLSSACDLGELITVVKEAKASKVDYMTLLLPFDQFPGRLLGLVNPEIRRDISSIFNKLLRKDINHNGRPRYAIHIRRGDVTPESFPHWYISDSHYCNLIDAISTVHSGDVAIDIVTQGEVRLDSRVCRELLSDGRLKISSSPSRWTNDMEIEAMNVLMNANYIVGGLSSFSMLPAWIRHGMHGIAFRKRGAGEYPHPIRIGCEVFIDEDIMTMTRKIHEYINKIDQCMV